ncbi:MAG: substrate-binding periplasmic protein [Magnetovibrionaceae bacterium]
MLSLLPHKAITALLLVLLAMQAAPTSAEQVVRVGAYSFPPFAEQEEGQLGGITPALLETLNGFQDTYRFELVATSPNRRYRDFMDGRFDLMFFESPAWGWQAKGLPVETSEEFLKGGEVYITRAVDGRDQGYFDDLTGKKVAGILGYHYGYADFKSDPDLLRSEKGMILVIDAEAIINLVRQGRADLGIVTQSYLQRHLNLFPDQAGELLVSDRLDQAYSHRVLVRKGARPSAHEMTDLLGRMQSEGVLSRFLEEQGLTPE